MPAAVIADEALTALEGKDRELEAKAATIECLSAELTSQAECVSKLAAEVCPQVASTKDMLHRLHSTLAPCKAGIHFLALGCTFAYGRPLRLYYLKGDSPCLYMILAYWLKPQRSAKAPCCSASQHRRQGPKSWTPELRGCRGSLRRGLPSCRQRSVLLAERPE